MPRSKNMPENRSGSNIDFSGSATLADGTRVTLTQDHAKKLWEDSVALQKERAEKLPDEETAINAMSEAFYRLKELGWRDACYCPKDGSEFLVIEAGSTGIHRCIYQGDWPSGGWWIIADCDLWPLRPVLFKLYPEDEARRKERFAEAVKMFRDADIDEEPRQ